MKRITSILLVLAVAFSSMPAIAQRNQIIKEICDMPDAKVIYVSSEMAEMAGEFGDDIMPAEINGIYIIASSVTEAIKNKIEGLLADKRYKVLMQAKNGESLSSQLVRKDKSGKIIESIMVNMGGNKVSIIYAE